jgi:cell wall-associated NlpC family hydrolase
MIKNYQHLLGKQFVWESDDCFGLLREFYKLQFDIEMPDFARPHDFWSKGMNLYVENAYSQGFRPIDVHPTEWQFGDVFLMAIDSRTANHAAILVEDNQILHHMYNQLSKVELYSGRFRNLTVGVYRHKDVKIEQVESQGQLLDLVSPHIRKKIDALREAQGISE